MMPNKTIYVADADSALYDRAQALAGGNLSAAIAEALRRFVEGVNRGGPFYPPLPDDPEVAGGAARSGANVMEAIIVKVGNGGAYTQKRFNGRLLGTQHVASTTAAGRQESLTSYRVYQTEKGHFALYISEGPNWSGDWRAWGNWGGRGGRDSDTDRRARQEERHRRRGDGAPWDWRGYAGYPGGWGDAPEAPAPPTPPTPPSAPDAPDAPSAYGPGLASQATTPGSARRDGAWWESNRRLEVYDTLDELRAHIPAELAAVVVQALSGAEIEDLDI